MARGAGLELQWRRAACAGTPLKATESRKSAKEEQRKKNDGESRWWAEERQPAFRAKTGAPFKGFLTLCDSALKMSTRIPQTVFIAAVTSYAKFQLEHKLAAITMKLNSLNSVYNPMLSSVVFMTSRSLTQTKIWI